MKKEVCGTGLCDATQGICRLCKAGETNGCSAGSMKSHEVCSDDGKGFVSVVCNEATPFCLAGACVECLATTDCTQPPVSCSSVACTNGICTPSPMAKGTVLPDAQQIPQDCNKLVCDGNGSSVTAPDDLDLPPDSTKLDCLLPSCKDGKITVAYADIGKSCSSGGDENKGVCQGDSVCGECLKGSTSCDGDTLVTCPMGNFVYDKCDPATPVCSANACVSVSHLAAGDRHTCVLLSNGYVTCWGDNSSAQLGVTSLDNFHHDNSVTGLTDAVAIAAGGENTCAIRQNGRVVCWGDNSSGQLGGGDQAPGISATPIEVMGVDQAIAIAVGYQFACAIGGTNQEVFCWGNNSLLQLGNLDVSQKSSSAVKVATNTTQFKLLTAGHDHACSATASGSVYCWGSNKEEQCGKNNGVPLLPPTLLQAVPSPPSLAAGANHTCAVFNNGLTCWGGNIKGQLGTGMTSEAELPSSGVFGPVKNGLVAAGGEFTCVLAGSQVRCVGANTYGQAAVDPNSSDPALSPVFVYGEQEGSNAILTNVVELVAGQAHACLLDGSNRIFCWGNNTNDLLGHQDSSTTKSSVALQVKWSAQ